MHQTATLESFGHAATFGTEGRGVRCDEGLGGSIQTLVEGSLQSRKKCGKNNIQPGLGCTRRALDLQGLSLSRHFPQEGRFTQTYQDREVGEKTES
jgi:hypothetical protein